MEVVDSGAHLNHHAPMTNLQLLLTSATPVQQQLPPGDVTLTETLEVTGEVHLTGADSGSTRIHGTLTEIRVAAGARLTLQNLHLSGVRIQSAGTFHATGCRITHTQLPLAAVIACGDGDVVLKDCFFSDNPTGGVLAAATSRLDMDDCHFAQCPAVVVHVCNQARLQMRRCRIQDCSYAAVNFIDESGGEVHDCHLEDCKQAIRSSNSSAPSLARNLILGGESAIVVSNNAQPIIEDNDIAGQSRAGIVCFDESQPLIEHNTLRNTGRIGINAEGASHPQLNFNLLARCQTAIMARQACRPELRNNALLFCSEGIHAGETAHVTAERLTVMRCQLAGKLQGRATLSARGALLQNNGRGFDVADASSLMLSHSSFGGTAAAAIIVSDQARADLQRNDFGSAAVRGNPARIRNDGVGKASFWGRLTGTKAAALGPDPVPTYKEGSTGTRRPLDPHFFAENAARFGLEILLDQPLPAPDSP